MADFYYYLNRQGIRGLQGVKGDQGDSPIITVQTETPNEYILKITNPDGTELISPNLRGNKININEGTYVRYNTDTGELYTSTADGATGELAGVVRLATDADITNMDENAAVTPSQLTDALSQYLVSPDGSVKIIQNAENSLTELTAEGGLKELPIASADTLGAVKIGENLSITEDGVLSSTASGDVSGSGDNTFTGTNDFNGAVNLNGITTAENLTVTRNLTSSGEINAVSIKSTGVRSDDIKTTTNKKYLTEEDVDNQTIQIVEGKLHANLDELGNEVNSLSNEVTSLSGRVTVTEADVLKKQNKLVQGDNITLTNNEDGTTTIAAESTVPTNMVTTDTTQTISGAKTFTQGITTTDMTCEGTLIAANIKTTAMGTIKLAHPMNNASGIITLNNNYGQLSISSSLGGNNSLLGVVRGTAYALINGDNITTRDKDGNERIYINTGNLAGSDNITISNPTDTVAAKIDISQALLNRISTLETTVASLQTQIGEISAQLDVINGEVI